MNFPQYIIGDRIGNVSIQHKLRVSHLISEMVVMINEMKIHYDRQNVQKGNGDSNERLPEREIMQVFSGTGIHKANLIAV